MSQHHAPVRSAADKIAISFDDLFQRLVDQNLGTDAIRHSDGERVRYSDKVIVGEATAEDGSECFILYPQHENAEGRRLLKCLLDELFADCLNVTIKQPTKPITV